MSGFSTVLFVLLLVAVVGVLFAGLGSMLVGGEFNRKYGNKLMAARVALQGAAIALLLLLVMCSDK